MRLSHIAVVFVGSSVLGCGSSSSSNLFSGAGQCSVGTTAACVGAMNCPGHGTCGPDGRVVNCVCDSTGTGGAAGMGGVGAGGIVSGSGGVIPFGGSGGAGTGGDFMGTGGMSGGFGGNFDGSFPMGGAGGSVSSCPEGHYSGTYTGMYGGLIPSQVDGTIDFSVDSSGNVTGHYSGKTPNTNSKADLTGRVDCTTLVLDMRVENGTYPGVLGTTVKFSGTMPGSYAADTHSWSGTWNISDNNSSSGSGTWTAS